MSKITYTDKVAIYENTEVPDINKVKANDMNEIKTVVNENDTRLTTGWYKTGINPTFTFVSYDSETLTGVVSSNLDMTPYLSVGMKVRFVQNATTKYGIIVAINSTQIALFMGTDYTLGNSVITDAYYSMLKSPYGFPMGSDKWSLKATLPSGFDQAKPEAKKVYTTGLSLLVPIGKWKIKGNGTGQVISTSTTAIRVITGISTANNSYNDLENVTLAGYNLPSNGAQTFFSGAPIEFSANLSSNTTYYYNMSTSSTGVSSLQLVANTFANTPTIIAICDYL